MCWLSLNLWQNLQQCLGYLDDVYVYAVVKTPYFSQKLGIYFRSAIWHWGGGGQLCTLYIQPREVQYRYRVQCVCVCMCVFIHAGNTYVIAPLGEINSGGDKRRRVVIELFNEKKDSNIIIHPLPPSPNLKLALF
jgi:hypothetical protein